MHRAHTTHATLAADLQQGIKVCFSFISLLDLQDLLPSIINQLGPDNLANLKKIAEQYKKEDATGGDDDIPDLVENFEAVSASDKPAEETKQWELPVLILPQKNQKNKQN